MKNYLFLFFTLLFLSGCSKDSYTDNNPYLPNYNFSIDINMDLPSYTNLKFPANAVLIRNAGIGVRGIIVFNTGSGYNAFEASCPNQPLSDCSTLTLHGIKAICPCDDAEYSLFDGWSQLHYPLRAYRVQIVNQNIIRVYN